MPFEPRRVFRRATHEALRGYFETRGIDLGVDWDSLEPNDWKTICQAWQELDDQACACVASDFYEVNRMATEAGIRAIQEQGRSAGVDLVPLMECSGDIDFVLRVYAQHQEEVWRDAVRWTYADEHEGGQGWQRYDSLPSFTPDPTEDKVRAFAAGLSAYFRAKEGRGQHCLVEHARRANGQRYFFAYLSDYPMARERFDGTGELLRSVESGVFVILVACAEAGGFADICASGGRKVRDEVLRIFGSALTEVELEPNPDATAGQYALDQLKKAKRLSFDPSMVKSAQITGVRFKAAGGGRRTMELKADPERDLDIHYMLSHWVNQENVPITTVRFQTVFFSIELVEGEGRQGRFSFYVTRTGRSNLRSKKNEYQVLGEDLLIEWGVIDEPATGAGGAIADARAAS